ncbi:hypothetical protein [Phreatobacter sp.]|uniref:hypothetical protein n=1 Tax=Phreatobacter sp. TaxID=1966341 RepID=UPI0025DF179A|nr:hypothetical protein [Phreatobacter sp.]
MKRMISRLRPSDNASILEALKSKSRGFAKVDVDLGAVANEINDLLKLPGAESEIDISGVSCSTDSPTGLVSAGEAVQDFRGKSSTTIDTYRRRIAKEYAAADESLKDTPVFSSVVQNDLQGLSISDGYREFISKFGLMTDDLRSEDLFEENIRGLLFRRDLHIILSRACYASDLIEYIDNQVAESANGKYHLLTQAAETLEKAWNSGRCVLSIKQVTLIALLYGIDVSYSQRQIIVHSGAISWFQFRYGVFLADFSITEHMVEEFVHHMRLRTEGAVYDGSELWDEIFKGFSGEWFGTDVTASIARICAEGVNISVPSGSREAAETLMKSLPASFKVKFDPWAASRQRKGSRGAPRFPRPGG